MGATVWQKCLSSLERELPTQQFSTWIRPLQAESSSNEVKLLAPNQYIRDKVSDNFLERIKELVIANGLSTVSLQIGSSTGMLAEKTLKKVEKPKERNHFYRLL
ncbi:MAG: chromosomal replication initiator protein, partial [Candidatus Azotimanducaceae bacterium]